MFDGFFRKLGSLMPSDGDQSLFLNSVLIFKKALQEYFCDFDAGFPGPTYFGPTYFECDPSISEPRTEDDNPDPILELRFTIMTGDNAKLLRFLQGGADSNTRQWVPPLCGWAFPFCRPNSVSEEYAINIRETVELLLGYGADPFEESDTQGTYLEGTYLESVVEYALLGKDPVEIWLSEELIRLVMWIDAGRSNIFVADELLKTRIGRLVNDGNKECALIKSIPAKIYDAELNKDQINFNTEQGVITLETKTADKLKPEEKKKLFLIFKANFPWQGRIPKPELKAYFYEKFEPGEGEGDGVVLVDLLRKDGKICAFNIAKIFSTVRANDKKYIIHHGRLAVAEKEVTQCRRLMTIVSFLRGFVIKQLNPQSDVHCITLYQAAARESYLQAEPLRPSPKYAWPKGWMELFKKVVYPKKIREGTMFERNGVLYSKSILAIPKPNTRDTIWATCSDHSNALFEKIEKPGYGIVVAFENTMETFFELSKVVDPNLLRITLCQLLMIFIEKTQKEQGGFQPAANL